MDRPKSMTVIKFNNYSPIDTNQNCNFLGKQINKFELPSRPNHRPISNLTPIIKN